RIEDEQNQNRLIGVSNRLHNATDRGASSARHTKQARSEVRGSESEVPKTSDFGPRTVVHLVRQACFARLLRWLFALVPNLRPIEVPARPNRFFPACFGSQSDVTCQRVGGENSLGGKSQGRVPPQGLRIHPGRGNRVGIY